ncbi:MAG: aldo/keto reductase [Verrucomicrobiae bacterium]|nr:aldo/keto reductase [Verrucomicrobiae bacterium]NNJ44256.1 aldo/keto reductase [Akkermansiaceae bacterium]
MDYQVLGNTGLNVSRLSYGASALGSVFRTIDEGEGIRAVHAALDAGINYIDVAPAYGGTVAESVLGKALRDVPRDRYFLSTKAGKYTAPGGYGTDELDYSEARIRAGLEESMDRLGVDYLDIVHLHDFEYQHFSLTESAFEEGFPTLVKLKEEGVIGAVSAGIYPMDLWQRVVAEAPVDAILLHNHYCLSDTRGLELVDGCKARNIGMINASPFASGLLTGGPIADWHPAGEAERSLFGQAADYCEKQGASLAKLAFQFSCQDAPFQTTMFSSSRTSSVERNLAWREEPLDQALLAEVLKILKPVIDKQWDYDAGIDRLKD